MEHYNSAIRPLLFLSVLTLVFGYIIYDFVSHNPVFGPSQRVNEDIASSWELYLKDRAKRNLRAMNMSYDELVAIAQSYEDIGERDIAVAHYYKAKTIFPERIEPRVQLCYLYLKQCQVDWRYCRSAKRELYYAEKYLDSADPDIQAYLSQLIDIMDMKDVVQMDEGAAMKLIF